MTIDLYPTRRGGAVRVLPRRDPVLHGDAATRARGPLTPEQLADYERDGFVVLPGVLSASEVDTTRVALDRLRQEARVLRETDGVIREPGSETQRSLFDVHRRRDALGALSRHPLLRGAAQQVLGGDVYVHQSRLNLKQGLGGAGFSWHSDFETWHAEDGMPRMRALSASVFLDDNHAWNGALMLIPGSHRDFVTSPNETPPDHYRMSLVEQEIGTPSAGALTDMFTRAGRIEIATGTAGTVVLFDCNVMHASTENLSPLARQNVFVCFNAVDNALTEPFGAPHRRPTFLASRDFSPVR